MTDQTPTEPAGLPGLLLLVSGLTLVGVVAIAVCIALATWWALAGAMFAFLGGAVAVAVGVVTAIDGELPHRHTPA